MAYGAGVVEGARQPELAQQYLDGLTRGPVRRRPARGGLRAAANRMSAFRAALVVSLALALVFLTLPVLAIFVDQPPSELLAAPRRAGRARRAVAEPADDGRCARDHRARRHAGRLPARHAPLPRADGGDHADRAAARAPAGRRGHRAAGRGRAVRDPGGPDRGLRRSPHVRDRRRGRRAHVRRGSVLPAPGAGGVRRDRSALARGLAHARRVRGAHVRARRRSRPRHPACSPAARSRSAARSGSSAPR